MSKTWRRVSKDDRAAWGSKKERAPRRGKFEDDYSSPRGSKRAATKHINPSDYDDYEDYDEQDSYSPSR